MSLQKQRRRKKWNHRAGFSKNTHMKVIQANERQIRKISVKGKGKLKNILKT